MHGSWDIERDGCSCYFSFFFFFPRKSHPLIVPKMKIWKKQKKKKTKKKRLDILSFHDHMVYCSWDMAYDRCTCYFSFWAAFCPINPLTTQNNKIYKNEKAPGDIIIPHICVPKIMIRWCTVPEKWCTMDERTDEQMEKVTHGGRCPTYKEVESPEVIKK